MKRHHPSEFEEMQAAPFDDDNSSLQADPPSPLTKSPVPWLTCIQESYIRDFAFEAGYLIDVTKLARKAGFRCCPVAITRYVWEEYVEVTDKVDGQGEISRLWNILNALRSRIGTAKDEHVIYFLVLIAKDGKEAKDVRLKALFGPGDNAEPVITIMLPEDD
jgi:hypothetical protein